MKTVKRKWILCLIVFLGLCGLAIWARWRPAKRFENVPATSAHFRVVTWNVGYFAPVSDKNLKDSDIDGISEVLSALNADVVVLQELARPEQADLLRDQLGQAWDVYTVKTGHGNQVMAVLTTLDGEAPDFIECGGRMTVGISLATGNGKQVYVLGVHAPHPARGIGENEENIRCALEVAGKRPEAVRIITGDLNYNFDPGSEGDFYSEIMKTYGDGTLELGETYYAKTRIDHVFHYPKELTVVHSGSGMVDLPIRFAKVPGFRDHRPLVVTYQLE